MKFELNYGKGTTGFELDEKNLLCVLEPNDVPTGLTGAEEVQRALNDPIGSGRLSSLIQPGEKVCIITSDITRPVPSHLILPPVLDELQAAGVGDEDIMIVFALGIHRKHTEAEMRKLVSDSIYDRVRCVDSDPDDVVHMGTTSRGTPVDIFREVAEADRRILIGNIEYHYFAGYSGGMKAIMPGVSTREAIQANHSRMVIQGACAGRLEGNPVREDIEEVAKYVPVDFIVNVVLDEHKQVIKTLAVAGHPMQAHREGCLFLDSLYKKKIPSKADIVIVSAGGFPKDINLYQAQKALDNAKHAAKKGGIIILTASCAEGFGEDIFEEWMLSAESPQWLVERIQADFQLGGHKAAAIGMVLKDTDIYFVSDMPNELVRRIMLKPFACIQDALEEALLKLGKNAQVIVMPYGGSTLPHE